MPRRVIFAMFDHLERPLRILVRSCPAGTRTMRYCQAGPSVKCAVCEDGRGDWPEDRNGSIPSQLTSLTDRYKLRQSRMLRAFGALRLAFV